MKKIWRMLEGEPKTVCPRVTVKGPMSLGEERRVKINGRGMTFGDHDDHKRR